MGFSEVSDTTGNFIKRPAKMSILAAFGDPLIWESAAFRNFFLALTVF
jgi:hypothetical protein